VAALALGLLGSAASAENLRVLSWEGYADPDWVNEFSAETGIGVDVVFVGSDDEIWAKIKGSEGKDFDVFAVNTAQLQRYIDASLVQPMFIDAVAAAIGMPSASIVLRDQDGLEVFAVTSDRTARLAHDLEFVVGEGPSGDVSAFDEPIQISGETLRSRWLRFGPMVADHGVQAVVGVPLHQQPGDCLGALCVYVSRPVVRERVVAASTRVADALTHTVLNLPGAIAEEQSDASSLFDDAAFHATVNQAAGIVSVHHGCQPDDAVALLRARAFADGTPIEVLAERIVRGEARL